MNKLTKRLAAIGAAMTMAVSMMSISVSASVAYNWQLKKIYGQPAYTVKCSGNVTNLSTTYDDGIDFRCNYMSNNDSDVQFDITSSFKKKPNQKAALSFIGDFSQIQFKSAWYSAYVANGYKCGVSGNLINDISTTYTATGTAA